MATCIFTEWGSGCKEKYPEKPGIPYKDHSEIVLFFDNDEPGRKAVEEAASVLPPGSVFIARMDKFKDASDALQAKEVDTLKRAMWNASPYRPDGIVDARNLLELVTTPNPPHDYEYKETGLNNLLHGIRHGELITVTAGSGQGNPHGAGTLQLTFFRMETGSVTWLLKNRTDELSSD